MTNRPPAGRLFFNSYSAYVTRLAVRTELGLANKLSNIFSSDYPVGGCQSNKSDILKGFPWTPM